MRRSGPEMRNRWLMGARLHTLPAAVAPVVVGTAVAAGHHRILAWRAGAALVVALGLQVGVNYANDYQDGRRGTDRDRVGPLRLVGSGLASAREVRTAAVVALIVAAAAGTALAVAVSPWLFAVGAGCMAAAWLYTGGPRPYGYGGLGEAFVFVCFGLVAVTGSAYVQDQALSWLAVGAAVPIGLVASALLVVNNLRDIQGDAANGKRTLAVRLGSAGTRRLYAGLVVGAVASPLALTPARPLAALSLLTAPLAASPVRRVLRGERGSGLVDVLRRTARLELALAAAMAIGVWR